MVNNPIFSVIIPTCHRNDLLIKCLNCLAPGVQTLSPKQYEVIVTDDGSKTSAEQLITANYPWARWVPGPRKGAAANRNVGARHAKGEWLAFTDDDCLPDSGWLEAYSEALALSPTTLVFEGRTYVDRPRRSLAETSPVNETGGHLWSCNFAIKRQLFEALGGFDERFPYAAMEDKDLALRIEKLGNFSTFVKKASVCHPWRATGGWKQLSHHRKSTAIYLNIHPEEIRSLNAVYFLRLIWQFLIQKLLPVMRLEYPLSITIFYQLAHIFLTFILVLFVGMKRNLIGILDNRLS
ncbi:MAG: glycosyltransferase family 2 protein [Anaerolineae bacterium]|nr:glycosyltransferase family 2 protein [Anaerolineae bacterium]